MKSQKIVVNFTIEAKSVISDPTVDYDKDSDGDGLSDYQDVKLISETADDGTFLVTIYPYNTNTVASNYNWKDYQNDSLLKEYFEPTICANFDEELKALIKKDLKEQGIDIDSSKSDRDIVKETSQYLLNNTKFLNEFTTYFTCFNDGKPAIIPGLESAFQDNKGNKDYLYKIHLYIYVCNSLMIDWVSEGNESFSIDNSIYMSIEEWLGKNV